MTASERPSASERAGLYAESQRTRILDAAQAAFIADGFHAATMADIAARAEVSAGLIYRYFAGKRDIVLAIIDRQLERERAGIAALDASHDIAARLLQLFIEPGSDRERRMNPALFLETSSEAMRDVQVAAAIRASDGILRTEFRTWLARDKAEGGFGLAPARAPEVALLLQCVADGLEVRRAREPELDRALLESMLTDLQSRLLRGVAVQSTHR